MPVPGQGGGDHPDGGGGGGPSEEEEEDGGGGGLSEVDQRSTPAILSRLIRVQGLVGVFAILAAIGVAMLQSTINQPLSEDYYDYLPERLGRSSDSLGDYSDDVML